MFIFVLIFVKPSKSDIIYDDYCQEALDHSMLSDYPISKLQIAFLFSFNIHVGWYQIVFKGG